jgi:nitrate reductase gamma subunit
MHACPEFTCEMTNLIAFLSLFSKMFFLWIFTVSFSFGLWKCVCGFSYTLFYPLSFWDKKGEYFFIWTGIVFLKPIK